MIGLMKPIPILVMAAGLAQSKNGVKDSIEKMFNIARVAAVQSEVNDIAKILYLDSFDTPIPEPSNFPDYVRRNMQDKKGIRDTSLDFWDTPYLLEKGDRVFTVRSAGPDKQFNTNDDIFATYRL